MNTKAHFFTFGLCLLLGLCCGQAILGQNSLPEPPRPPKSIGITVPATPVTPNDEDATFFLHEWHQIYLDKPAQSIQEIYYELDGAPIEGELSNDGMKVFIRNYKGKGRVSVKFQYVNGDAGEIARSSCHIDPVETS